MLRRAFLRRMAFAAVATGIFGKLPELGAAEEVTSWVSVELSGEPMAFRYVALYDATAQDGDALLGWWDYGSELTLASDGPLTVDFNASVVKVT